jgi:hypothetical protein
MGIENGSAELRELDTCADGALNGSSQRAPTRIGRIHAALFVNEIRASNGDPARLNLEATDGFLVRVSFPFLFFLPLDMNH